MSDQDTDEGSLSLDTIFTEPPRPPSPEPTIATFSRDASQNHNDLSCQWSTIDIRLVGSHPLWGHYLWNASKAFAYFLDEHPDIYKGRTILELGAGGGLPGIVAAKNGAANVVLTDYPDEPLLENLRYNVSQNVSPDINASVVVQGYIWGHSVENLIQIPRTQSSREGFDLLILSDLIFNHSQHDALLKTCREAVAIQGSGKVSTQDPCVLVFYTHHRPHLAHRDMEFFEKARSSGWLCEEILTQKYPPMFPEDPGEEEIRSTVHGWKLTRRNLT